MDVKSPVDGKAAMDFEPAVLIGALQLPLNGIQLFPDGQKANAEKKASLSDAEEYLKRQLEALVELVEGLTDAKDVHSIAGDASEQMRGIRDNLVNNFRRGLLGNARDAWRSVTVGNRIPLRRILELRPQKAFVSVPALAQKQVIISLHEASIGDILKNGAANSTPELTNAHDSIIGDDSIGHPRWLVVHHRLSHIQG